MKVLAIDIGGTKVATALIDDQLNITERKQIASQRNHTPASFEKYFADVVGQYDPATYDGIAIGTAGVVHEGIYTALTPTSVGHLDGMKFVEIFERLGGGKPLTVLNDAQAATWAEHLQAKKPNMCFITVSTGVGGGFVLNDEIVLGSHSMAGHVGHTLVRMQSPVKQVYGEFCTVEDVASGTAIAKATQNFPIPFSTAEVFEQQKLGNKDCDAIVKRAVEAIAQLVASIVVSNDIRDFYLGGSVAIYTDFIAQVQGVIDQMPAHYHARLYPAHFGQDAVLVGAADYFFATKK